jgi:ankyrin repeat protein
MDDKGFTPLIILIRHNALEPIVELLLEAGANPNLSGGVDHPLILAKKWPNIVTLLLKHGANINHRMEDLEKGAVTTPLMELISGIPGYEWEDIQILGPNLDDTDDHKNTLIHISHSYYFCHLAKSTNVNAENVHGETALFTCSTPTAEDLDCLFEQNANVTHVSKAGLTPLHNALLTKNRVLLLKLLQDHIAKLDLSVRDKMGRSMGHLLYNDWSFKNFHNAVCTKSLEERSKILEALNSVDCFGKTSIHYAVKSLSFASFSEFVKRYRLNVNPDTAVSPLSLAISEIPRASPEIAQLLLDLGASVTHQDSEGNTPLHFLCGRYPSGDHLIPLMLKKGASVTAKNKLGFAPVDLLPTIEEYLKPKKMVKSVQANSSKL